MRNGGHDVSIVRSKVLKKAKAVALLLCSLKLMRLLLMHSRGISSIQIKSRLTGAEHGQCQAL